MLGRVEADPTKSTRVAREMGTAHSSVWRVLHEQQLHPYHPQRIHVLLVTDFAPRIVCVSGCSNNGLIDQIASDSCCLLTRPPFSRDGTVYRIAGITMCGMRQTLRLYSRVTPSSMFCCKHSIRTYSRDSLGFSVVSILSAQVIKSCVVPLLLTRRF